MKEEFKKLFNHFSGEILIPLYNKQKYPSIKSWQTVETRLNQYKKASGVGIRIHKTKDICCLDIDLKDDDLTDEQRSLVREQTYKFIGLNGIYLEQTPSGGFHLFFKLKENDLKYLHDKFSVDDRYVCNATELYPSKTNATRQIAIYPSITKNGKYVKIFGEITNLDYINLEIIENFIIKLKNILGEKQCKKIIITKDKKIIELDIDKEYKKFKEETSPELKQTLIKLQNLLKENKLVEHYLEYLGLKFVVKDNNRINLYSIVVDDGENPDAWIYKDNLIYFDFHTNQSYPLTYITYVLFKEKVFNFLTTHNLIEENIKDSLIDDIHNNNITEYDNINEIKDKLLKGKKLLLAQTGNGKSLTIKKLAKEGHKIIMLEPLTVQVLQEDKNIEPYIACFCEGAKNREIKDNTSLIFCTYDKLKEVMELIDINDWKIVIDEAHELICALSYRGRVLNYIWDVIKNRNQYLLMTATNNLLYLNDYVDETYKIKPKKKKNRYFYNIKTNRIINQIVENVINIYPNNVVQFVYIDSKNNLKRIYNNLLEQGIKYEDITIVNSTNKIIDAKDIIEEMKTTKKIYLTTRVLSAGFHIMSNETFIYHIVPNDINVMIQESNRVREKFENTVVLYIYHNQRKKQQNVDYEKEWNKLYYIKKEFIKKINNKIEEYNNENKTKEYLEGNWNLLHATQHEYWIRYLVYNQLCPIASRDINYISKILLNEGFEDASTKVVSTDLILQKTETFTDYDKLFDEFLKEEIKLNPNENNKLKKDIYYIVRKIKQYKEVFDEEDLITYKNKIKEGKINSVKSSISRKINLYAIENMDKVGSKTKAILDTKFEELHNLLKDKKTVSKSVLQKHCKNLNISKPEMNAILKSLNFIYNKNKKRYIKN